MQFEILIENLNSQTSLYRSLKPVMDEVREKTEKSSEEMLEILRSSQDIIDAVSRLADERRVMEKHLSKMLGLEKFERMSLDCCLENALLESFDGAVLNLKDALGAVMDFQDDLIDEISVQKTDVVDRIKETSKGKSKMRSYYRKHSDACFIDKKTR